MTGQPPVRPEEISDLIAWATRLSRAGSRNVTPAEAATYLSAKADLLERVAASRDIAAARQAAAGARAAADAAAAPPPSPPGGRT